MCIINAGVNCELGCEELIRWSALRFLARGSFVSSVGNGKSGFTCSCCAYQAARGALRYFGRAVVRSPSH